MTDGPTHSPFETVEVSVESFAHLPSGIDLCHQTFGDAADEAVLLVMGLGGPMGWWPSEFCTLLAERGFFVVRYDNRDTGRSTKLRHHRVSRSDVVRAFLGRGSAPYGLDELADDAVGLLDHLRIDAAHVVGVSMGGMIAQTLAVEHDARVRSLTSMMSSTGARRAGWIDPRIIAMMLAPAGRTRPEFVENSVRNGKRTGSPAFPIDDGAARARATETYDRGWIASGVSRHMLAVLTQRDRTVRLGAVHVPTTVIHGAKDLLVHPSGGRATARAIRGAEFIQIAGLGHDLPPQLFKTFVDAIAATAARAR